MIKTMYGQGLTLTLNSNEIFPDDPGLGTPAVVSTPNRRFDATFNCALGEGELTDYNGGVKPLSASQINWLENQIEIVDSFLQGDG